MDGLDKQPDFGIQDTMDISGAGDSNLLTNLLSDDDDTGGAGTNPDDIQAIDKDTPPAKNEPPKTTDGEPIDDKTAKNPDALTNFLIGDNDDGDEPPAEPGDQDPPQPTNTEEPPTPGDGLNPNDEPPADPDTNTEGNIAFDALAAELVDQSVFSLNEGEEKIEVETAEDFLARFKMEKEKGANEIIGNFLGQFGQDYQDAFQAIYVNGVNPQEYFSKTAEIASFESLDMTKEANQERVVRQMLQSQGFEGEDLDAEVEKLRNYGDLEDASKRHHKVLVKNEKQELKQKEIQAQQAQQAKLAQKNEYITNVQQVLTEKLKAKEFDGIPLNGKMANELQDFLLVDKWKTASGETLTDFDKTILDLKRPENHETKVKVALLLRLLEKDPTLSTIQKRGISKETSDLFRNVTRQKHTEKRSVNNSNKPAPSWFRKS